MGNASSAGLELMSREEEKDVLNDECTVKKLVDKYLSEEGPKRVVVMAGAGISVSCGIPDFRTPGTGLYDNLQKYDLPTPQHVFDIGYFKKTKGKAFYQLAREMWPDNFKPSPTHAFIKLLEDKLLLHRCYTQNIDTLERAAGVSDGKIVEAHGSFATASCSRCKGEYDVEMCKQKILAGETPVLCNQKVDPQCKGIVKPDIVFFGESLPPKFHRNVQRDCLGADLLIVMGTSLSVFPFAGLIDMVRPECPRLLLNMEPAGIRGPGVESGLRLRQSDNYRDVMIQGDCDNAVRAICDYLGWRDDLENLVESLDSTNKDKDEIDWIKAFPSMTPGGKSYNWRRTGKLQLPELALAEFMETWSALETAQIESMESDSEHVLYVVGSNHETFGEKLEGLLCLRGDAKASWDEDDYIALVIEGSTRLVMSAYAAYAYLDSPNSFEKEVAVDIHRFELEVKSLEELSSTRLELWVCSNERGEVSARFGPFEFGSLQSRNNL